MELVVGRIGRPHGLRGEVTIEVRTDDPADRFAAGAVLRTDPETRGPLTVTSMRRIGGNTVVGFAGFADRTAAETLRNTLLLVESDGLPELLTGDEYYDHQLIGLTVRLADPVAETGDGAAADVGPVAIGTVTDVLHLPSNDVLVIATDRAPSGEVMVPFVRVIVPEVDVPAGFVTLAPPDGLFD